MAGVDACKDGEKDVCDEHARHAGEEHLPSADLVDQQGQGHAEDEALDGVSAVDQELRLGARHTNRIQDEMQIVRHQRVAAPLDHESQRQDHAEPVPIGRGPEPFQPGRSGVVFLVFERVVDLGHLELQELRVRVAFGVVFAQNLVRLITAVVVDQPTGRLGHEEYHDKLKDRGHRLQDTGQPPTPRVRHGRSAVCDPRRHDLAQRARGVQDTGDLGTLRGVRQLRDQDGTCGLLDVIPEADENASDHEHGGALRGRLQRDAQHHDPRANGNGLLPSISLNQGVDHE